MIVILRFLFVLFLLPQTLSLARAADQHELAVKVAKDFVVPHYAALANTAAIQKDAWQGFCAKPEEAALGQLGEAFQATADAWSGIDFLRYGPVSNDFRYDRIAHWPERRNAVSRALSSLLSRDGLDTMSASQFSDTSAAGQGLTALERVLFDEDSRAALISGKPGHECAVGRLIANNLALLSAAILKDWEGKDGTLAQIEQADEAGSREFLTRFATDLLSTYQTIGDLKLNAVMGKELGEARPMIAEGRRAGRSTRSLIVNLQSLETATRLLLGRDDGQVLDAIGLAVRTAQHLPEEYAPLADDPKQRSRLVLLRDAVRSARDLSSDEVPATVGITLGFNSLDGD